MTNRDFVPLQETEEEKQKKKKPLLEYNNKTYRSYVSQGFKIPDNLDHQEQHFLSLVDPDKKDEIQRTVTKIVRLRAPDHSTKKKELKEYLVYYENWYGKDWLGRSVPPVSDHVEGAYEEQLAEPVYDNIRNRNLLGHKRSGSQTVHYIPFSKEKVDEIIENSVGSYKETIKYTFVSGALSYEFPYDKFVNLTFDELNQLLIRPGGPSLVFANEAANATNGTTISPSSSPQININNKQQK